MSQVFTGEGLGLTGSSVGQLGVYGPQGSGLLGGGGSLLSVNAATGNVVLRQSDGFLAGLGLGYDLQRSYNSLGEGGCGWCFNVESRLCVEGGINEPGSVVYRVDEDGHRSGFVFHEGRGLYVAMDGRAASLCFKGGHWLYRDGVSETAYDYDEGGQLTAVRDRDGHCLALSYEEGHLVRVVDSSGEQRIEWRFERGVLQEITTWSEASVVHHLRYEYDAQGRLCRVSRDLGQGLTFWVTYAYWGESTRLRELRESDGVALLLDYDASGRLIRLTDGEGRWTQYRYEAGHTVISNALGETSTYGYDAQGRLTRVVDGVGHAIDYVYEGARLAAIYQGDLQWRFAYNDAGDCVDRVLPSGERIRCTYDSDHRVLSETHVADGWGVRTSYRVYDERGHVRFKVALDGTVSECCYNEQGQLLRVRTYLKAGLTGQSPASSLSLSAMTRWAASQPPEAVSLVDYRYDWRGLLAEEVHYAAIDPAGNGVLAGALTTSYRYNAAGLLVEKGQPVAGGIRLTHYLYDDLGRLLETRDSEGHSERVVYDEAHRQVIATDARGVRTIRTYDRTGLLLATQVMESTGVSYGTTTYRYDEAGRLVRTGHADGTFTVYCYDAAGHLLAQCEPGGRVCEYTYDALGRVVQTVQRAGVVTADWSADSLTWAAIRPAADRGDRLRQTIYNACNQVAYTVDEAGGVIGFDYDAAGQVVRKTAYATRITLQEDVLLTVDTLLLVASEDDRISRYRYDEAGRLQAEVNGNGAVTGYTWDREGHCLDVCRYATALTGLYSLDWALPPPSPKDSHTYSRYNAAGLKVADIDALGYVTTYAYNEQGLVCEKRVVSQAIGIRRLEEGAALETLLRLSAADHVTTYRYDGLNRLIEQTDPNHRVTRYRYDERGQVVESTCLDARSQAYRGTACRYDALGRVIQQLNATGAALLRDSPGLSAAEQEAIWAAHSVQLSYDALGRLLSQRNARQETTQFFYNEAGLLQYTVTADGEVVEQAYNGFQEVIATRRYSNRLPGLLVGLTASGLAARLSELRDEAHDEVTTYAYHPTGLLASKTVGGHQETTVLYNAFGEVASTRQRLDADQVYQTTYRYDHQGLLRHRIEEGEGLYRDSETQYDVWGRVSKAIDARQGETTYRVNARGECTLIENAVHSSKTMSYDAFGRVVSESALVAKAYTYDDETNTVTIRHVGEDTTTILQFNAFGDKVCLDDNGAVTTWCYDENGQLLAVEKPEGQGMAYRYDEAGHLVWQQDNEGRVIVYTYDATGRVLTKIIDPEGLALTTTYRYDGIGRQLQVVEADGLCKRFTYNAAGQLQQTCIDPEGLQLRTDFVYDERGLLVRQVEHLDAQRTRVTAYEWDALGRCVATIRDAEGLKLTTRTGYDANNNRVWETDANQHTRHWVYDANNRCRYEVDARGVVTAHHYDSRDNECKTVVYAHRLSRVDNYTQAGIEALLKPDEQDCYQFRTFDRAGRVRLVFDALGYATRYVYDVKGNVVSQVRYAQAFSLARLKEGYAPEPRDETNARVTYMAYDGLNQLRYRVDAQGAVTSFHYNRAGQVSQTTRFYVGLPLQQMKRDFSCAGIEAKLTLHADQDQTTRYAYDKAGRLVYQLSPEGAVTRYDYDGASRRIATCQYATRLNPTGLDAQWPERVMASTADRLTRFVFDAAGRERYRISAEGRVLERCYDAVGNVVAEVRHTWRLADGAPLSKDALEDDKGAQRTRWTYDTLGRLVQKTDAAGGQTAYTYDGNNNVITQTDARQARWTYGYDEANQLVETRSPEVSVTGEAAGQWVSETRAILTRHTYDSFGNVVETVRDAEGLMARRVYVYDALNRCVETRYPDVRVDASGTTACAQRNEVVQTLTEVNRYNAFGEVVAKQDRAGYWSYTAYNGRGEVLYTLGADGELTGCEYDGLGRLTGKTRYATRLSLEALGGDYSAEAFARGRCVSADDRQERCEYDRENRLVKVRQAALRSYNGATRQYAWAEPTRRFTYNAFGEVIEEQVCRQAGEWATTRFQYDRDGLKVATLDAGHYLTTWSYNALGETEAERAYAQRAEVGANGEWTRPPVAAEDRWVVFAYDALSRLTAKTFKQVSHARLTADGRRYETLTGEVTTTYTYDALDHLTSTTDTMGYRSFCYYDALGQLIARVGPATAAGQRAVSYGYDGLGQLVETTWFAEGAAAADETTFRLRGKSAKDQTTHSLYDAEGRLLAEVDGLQHAVYYSYDGRGQVTRRWQSLTGVDGTLQRRDQRYRYDEAGSLLQTATLTEAGSLITEDACYNAFGEVIAKGRNGRFTTHMDYDTAGRVWRSNSAGFYQIYVYDLTDKVTQVVTSTHAFNGQWGEEGLDLSTGMASDTLSFSDGAWRYGLTRQDTVYDALGHLMSKRKESVVRGTTHEDRLQAVEEVETTDRWGNVLSHTSARGLTTRMRYNAFDQVVEQVLPPVEVCNERGERQWLAPTVRYAYDALGRALAVTDANGHTVAKLLDAEGQVLADIDAKGNRRVKTYDLFGNRVSSRTERGALTTYVYDKANRLIELKTATGSQRSQYDEAGQLVAQTDALGAHRRVWYDAMGQRIAQEDQGRVTQYAYDDAGHQVLERDAQGHTRTWAYNEAGQLIRHGDLGGHVTTYRYNRNGLLLEEVSTAGKHLQYHYQGDGALMQYVDNVHHETVDYAYDQDGNVVAKTASRTVQGPDDGWLREMDVYAYDALGRLVTVRRRSPQDTDSRFPDKDHALLNIDYQYDAVGNIRHTQVMANYSGFQPLVGDEYYTYDETNRLVINKGRLVNGVIQAVGSESSETVYDASGNVTDAYRWEDGQRQHYRYGYGTRDGLVEQVVKNDALIKASAYDALGRLERDYRYDSLGQMAQCVTLTYVGDLLVWQTMIDGWGREVSKTAYAYDAMGLLTAMVSQTTGGGSVQEESRTYTYALWDTYLQAEERAQLTVDGRVVSVGSTWYGYDVNGELIEVADAQALHSTRYKASAQEGVRGRRDGKGQTHYLTVGGKTIGDVQLNTNGEQRLHVYSGFTPTGGALHPVFGGGLPGEGASHSEVVPETPTEALGVYRVQAGDDLERVALQVYGDSSLWYLIADANGLTARDKGLHSGQRLVIPPAAASHHTAGTHRVVSAREVLGEVSASLPSALSPPASPVSQGHKPHSLFKKMVVAAVAVVSVVLIAAAIATLAGAGAGLGMGLGKSLLLGMKVLGGGAMHSMAGSLAAGFVAGAGSSLISQGVAKGLGLQPRIDGKSALLAGLSTAASAGLLRTLGSSALAGQASEALDKVSPRSFSLTSAAQMMAQDGLSQGLALAMTHHQHFDWLQLGSKGALGGVLGSQYGNATQQRLSQHLGPGSAAVLQSEASALASGGLQAAAQHQRFDAAQVLSDNLGQAIGEGVVQGSAQSAQSAEAAPLDEADYCPIQKEEDGTYSLASEHVYQRLVNRRARVLAGIQASSEIFSLNGQEATSAENKSAVLNTVEELDSLIPPTSMVNDFSKLGYEGYQKYKVNTILNRAGGLQKNNVKRVTLAKDLQAMQGLFKSSSSQSYQLIDKALNSRTYKLFNIANKTLGVGYVGAEAYIAYEANASQGKNAQLREATSVGVGTAVAWSGTGTAAHITGRIAGSIGLSLGGPIGGIIGYNAGAVAGYFGYNYHVSDYVKGAVASSTRYVWNKTHLVAKNLWNLPAEERNILLYVPGEIFL